MLVLSRKRTETIVCRVPGVGDIVITLTDIRNTQVARIGVDAPESVKIFRGELLGEADKWRRP